MLQNSGACSLKHFGDFLEVLEFTVVRVRHLGVVCSWIERASEANLVRLASGPTIERGQVRVVHRHDEVELFEVSGPYLACFQVHVAASQSADLDRSAVGRRPHVPITGPGRVDHKIHTGFSRLAS